MRKHRENMLSLEVMIERLPEAVIAALEGPNVKQDFALLQSMPALDMTTVAMLLRRKVHKPVPLMEVALGRLPESMKSTLMSKRNDYPVVALERIPEDKMKILLAQRKIMLMASKEKKKVGRPKKLGKSETQMRNIPKATLLM